MSLQLFSKGWLDTSTFPIITPLFDSVLKSNLMGNFVKKIPVNFIRCFLFNFEPSELILSEYRNRSSSHIALATFYQCVQVVNAINLVNRALKNANCTPRPLAAHLAVVLPLFLVQIPPIVARKYPLDRLPKSEKLENLPPPAKFFVYMIKAANDVPKACRDHLSKVTQAVTAIAAIVLWKQGEKAYAAGVIASLVYPLALKFLAASFEPISSKFSYAVGLARSFCIYGSAEEANTPIRQAIWSVVKQQLPEVMLPLGLNWINSAALSLLKAEAPEFFDVKISESFDLESHWVVGKPPLIPYLDVSWPKDRFSEQVQGDIEHLLNEVANTDKAYIAQMLRSIAKDQEGEIDLDVSKKEGESEKKDEPIEKPRRRILLDEWAGGEWSETLIYSQLLITRCYLANRELERERKVMMFVFTKLAASIKRAPAILATPEDQVEAAKLGYFQIEGVAAVNWLYQQPRLMSALFKDADLWNKMDIIRKLVELGFLVPKTRSSKIIGSLIEKLA